MSSNVPQFVGASCGHHGSYTFYKAFKYLKHGKYKILTLGEFFFVRIPPDDDPCIGELQLLWEDKNSDQLLSSMRLYFLPEQTPEGRKSYHGEHEVLAASEKVILRLVDLVQWITEEVEWSHGLVANSTDSVNRAPCMTSSLEKGPPLFHSKAGNGINLNKAFSENVPYLNISDVEKDKKMNHGDVLSDQQPSILVLSYARYCRYRAMLIRLSGLNDQCFKNLLVVALGGITLPNQKTRVLFCRDTFDHDALANNDSNCDHLAPNLKGRPRKKKAKINRSNSPSSESNASEETKEGDAKMKIECTSNGTERKASKKEQEFLQKLFKFMQERNTPINRVPHLGFKQIDLYWFFTCVQNIGGYEKITSKKLWKNIYDELGGNPESTSAATCTRRHYERLLLPFEIYMKGTEDSMFSNALSKKKKVESTKKNHIINTTNRNNAREELETSNSTVFDNDSCMSEASTHNESVTQEERPKNQAVYIKKEDSFYNNAWLSDLEKQEQEWESRRRKEPKQKQRKDDILLEKEKKWNEIRKRNAVGRNLVKQVRPSRVISKSSSTVYKQLVKPDPQSLEEADKITWTTSSSSQNEAEASLTGQHLEIQNNNNLRNSEPISQQPYSLQFQHFPSNNKNTVESNSEKQIILSKYSGNTQLLKSPARLCSGASGMKSGPSTQSVKIEYSTAGGTQEPKSVYKTSIMSPLLFRKRSFPRTIVPSANSNTQLSLLQHKVTSQDLDPHTSVSGIISESYKQTARGRLLGGKEALDLPLPRPSVIHHTEKVGSPPPDQNNGLSQPIYEQISPASEPSSPPPPVEKKEPNILNKIMEHMTQTLPELTSRHSPVSPNSTAVSSVALHSFKPDQCKDTLSPLFTSSKTECPLLLTSALKTVSPGLLPSVSSTGSPVFLPSDSITRPLNFSPKTSTTEYQMSLPTASITAGSLVSLGRTRSHHMNITLASDDDTASQTVSYTGQSNLLPKNFKTVLDVEKYQFSALPHGMLLSDTQYYNKHSFATSDYQYESIKTRVPHLNGTFAHQSKNSFHALAICPAVEPISPVTPTPSPPLDSHHHISQEGFAKSLPTFFSDDNYQALDLTMKKNSSTLKQDPSCTKVQEYKKVTTISTEPEGCLDLSIKKKQKIEVVNQFKSPSNFPAVEKNSQFVQTNSTAWPVNICKSHINNEISIQAHIDTKVPIQAHTTQIENKAPRQIYTSNVNSKTPKSYINIRNKTPTMSHTTQEVNISDEAPLQFHTTHLPNKAPNHVYSQNTKPSIDHELHLSKHQTSNEATLKSCLISKNDFLASDSSKKAYVTEYNPQLPQFINPTVHPYHSPLLGYVQQPFMPLEAIQASVAACQNIIGRDFFNLFPQLYHQFYKRSNTP
ncbi:uncharacterized protein LOC106459575 isoform X2 [Limulus polyphemus]|uniref:Uncharacterized protein LOC106459575 isoform X2 n=1 Tax=Limulus polyphemus TaxID=6850 RepID=A0ABM1B4I3_LIMPO|nr:uncharacterized protein LOC106459575 isoform X2 [Limulus polyphemus]